MMKIFGCVFFCFVIARVSGQESIIALNSYTPVLYHPAWGALDNEASFSVVNRKTFVTSGISYQSNFFTAEFPFIDRQRGKRLAGIAIHASHKDAGSSDLLKAFSAGISLAYDLRLNKEHAVGFGLQSTYTDKRTSLENLTTGSQWLASEFRFDPHADLGEAVIENRVRYTNVNGGLLWRWFDHTTGKNKALAGITIFNLNKPNDSFLQNQNKIHLTYLFTASAGIYQTRKFELWPALLYYRTSPGNDVRFQTIAKFLFTNENPYDIIRSGTVDVIAQYDFQNNIALGISLNQPGVSIGFVYNFGVAIASAVSPFRNATEVGIRFVRTLWKPKPSTIVIANTAIGTKRSFSIEPGRAQTPAREPDPPSDVEVIQNNIGNLAKVNSVRFELDKDFKFAFGRSELSAEAKLYLDDLVKLLNDNPDYNLEIIGHTDNVGKPIVNYRLSSARAQAVAKYLVDSGLSPDRLKHAGRGDTEPLAPNDTEENRSRNRRVHFVVYVNR